MFGIQKVVRYSGAGSIGLWNTSKLMFMHDLCLLRRFSNSLLLMYHECLKMGRNIFF